MNQSKIQGIEFPDLAISGTIPTYVSQGEIYLFIPTELKGNSFPEESFFRTRAMFFMKNRPGYMGSTLVLRKNNQSYEWSQKILELCETHQELNLADVILNMELVQLFPFYSSFEREKSMEMLDLELLSTYQGRLLQFPVS